MTATNTTPEHTWDEVREAWETGAGLRTCAAMIGCSHEAVRARAEREGWAREGDAARTAEQRHAQTSAATERAKTKWAERRADEADAAGITAAVARQKIIESLQANDYRMVRASVGAYMVLVDKAQLLSGEATARFETQHDVRHRATALLDELAARRVKAVGE